MPRAIDHLIHLVRDLDATATAYDRLGFTVGAENRHPFGTKNRIVQFPGAFLEILAIGDHAPIPEAEPGGFSFAAFHRDRLSRTGEGGSGVALASRDATADARAFAKAGFGDVAPFFFERRGRRPDGSETYVAFELAFAVDPASPETCFFACEHKHPENFWNPAAQIHANGASRLSAAVLSAENPSDHHVFLRAFTEVHAFRASSMGLSIPLPSGEIDVLTPAAFAQRSGDDASGEAGLRLAAIRVAVRDLAAAERALGGAATPRGGTLVVPASRLFGLTLVLEPETAA